jgi:hypothetical protein
MSRERGVDVLDHRAAADVRIEDGAEELARTIGEEHPALTEIVRHPGSRDEAEVLEGLKHAADGRRRDAENSSDTGLKELNVGFALVKHRQKVEPRRREPVRAKDGPRDAEGGVGAFEAEKYEMHGCLRV